MGLSCDSSSMAETRSLHPSGSILARSECGGFTWDRVAASMPRSLLEVEKGVPGHSLVLQTDLTETQSWLQHQEHQKSRAHFREWPSK